MLLGLNRQEIGEQRAYEKACQALREGAPDVRRKLATQEVAAAALCSIGKTKPLFCAFSGEQQPAIIHSTTGGEQLTGASCKSDWKEDRDDVDQVATVREEQSSDDTERM